jgi:hypothetical protein
LFTHILAGLDFPEDVLYRTDYELAAGVKMPEKVAQNLKNQASLNIYPWEQKHIRASDLLNLSDKPDCITLGDATLDHVLGGGVFTRGISEVVGQRYNHIMLNKRHQTVS